MTLYVFDTDHLSLYGRNHPVLIDRLQQHSTVLTTTAINVKEQVRGRLAQISEARDGDALANGEHPTFYSGDRRIILKPYKI